VALFFVEAGERGQGIGGALLATAIGDRGAGVPATSTISVNSSPWAVPVYERLGFVATGPEIERNGIRAVPMARPV
jgi:predicted GNAT family N-acyltransferase